MVYSFRRIDHPIINRSDFNDSCLFSFSFHDQEMEKKAFDLYLFNGVVSERLSRRDGIKTYEHRAESIEQRDFFLGNLIKMLCAMVFAFGIGRFYDRHCSRWGWSLGKKSS